MTKHHVDTELTLTTNVTNNSVLVDPTTVAFAYRIGRDGTETSAVPVKQSTGVYAVTITPDKTGILYGTWTTTGTPAMTKPVKVRIYPKTGIKG